MLGNYFLKLLRRTGMRHKTKKGRNLPSKTDSGGRGQIVYPGEVSKPTCDLTTANVYISKSANFVHIKQSMGGGGEGNWLSKRIYFLSFLFWKSDYLSKREYIQHLVQITSVRCE